MRWTRPEQVVVLIAAAAVISGAVVLGFAREKPSIRIFEPPPQTEIVVQVDGAVIRPGVYHLPLGARAQDAISVAGGPATTADLTTFNRARPLRDGERLTVPHRTASATAPAPGETRIDLNAASARDLEALPGIGPVLAGRIVEYRGRHGPFQRLEDLLQVKGLGPRLLDRLRAHVMIR